MYLNAAVHGEAFEGASDLASSRKVEFLRDCPGCHPNAGGLENVQAGIAAFGCGSVAFLGCDGRHEGDYTLFASLSNGP